MKRVKIHINSVNFYSFSKNFVILSQSPRTDSPLHFPQHPYHRFLQPFYAFCFIYSFGIRRYQQERQRHAHQYTDLFLFSPFALSQTAIRLYSFWHISTFVCIIAPFSVDCYHTKECGGKYNNLFLLGIPNDFFHS